jgi:hypothetical protein
MALLRRNRRAGLTVLALTALVAGAPPSLLPEVLAASAPALVNTQSVYAAFTVNLTRFISWPDGTFSGPQAPLIIGTFPRDPINEALDAAVNGERVEGHPVETMRIQSLDDLTKCHVVFLSRGSTRPGVLARLANKPILTVSDADGFLELGGHVRFVPQATGTRLRMSVPNLKASGLESRAQLLRLAAAQ